MKVDDADQSPEKDAKAEAAGPQQKASGDQHRQQDPVRDLKPFLEGVFFGAVHFLYP